VAEYYGPQGEICEAIKLPIDCEIAGIPAKAGEWAVQGMLGGKPISVMADHYFKSVFKQRWPRPVGDNRQEPAPPIEKQSA
jgi:hypothetical protein